MKKIYLALLLFTFTAGNLYASGFGVFTQGANGLGQGNAVTAHVTGPSSLYFNPALLPQLAGTQIELGTTLIYAKREFISDLSGLTEKGESSAKFPSTFYATHQFNDQLSAGLGIFFPFGLTTEWGTNWEGRYIATKSELSTTNFNPVLAYQLNDQLSVAAGLDILYLDATLERQVNSTGIGFLINPPGGFGLLPDASQKFSGDGWGLGYNLGLLANITDTLSFGASYRSQIEVKVDGDLSFSIPTGAAPLNAVLNNTTGNSTLQLPQQASVGLAWDASKQLTVELGARWEGWSSTHDISINLDQPVLGQTADVTQREWKDSWAFNLGGEYQVNKILALRAGYLYSKNPVPDNTFEPSIPDADAQLFTLGTGLTFGPWGIDLAYGFEHHKDRNKTNGIGATTGATANGKYSANVHLAAVSIGYRF
ncbi:OmpP1/FadL family transporter [Geopsychrobacter electrodiphilus]|uniref:OmpP1/FadL family transporter n=1 Tax=Geopsychrobacter electrodiphilus TaxID=225196 RepID=UPI000380CAA1|nr:outer membrane protein transport protein [Geopsychrobacter electrodiphilus]